MFSHEYEKNSVVVSATLYHIFGFPSLLRLILSNGNFPPSPVFIALKIRDVLHNSIYFILLLIMVQRRGILIQCNEVWYIHETSMFITEFCKRFHDMSLLLTCHLRFSFSIYFVFSKQDKSWRRREQSDYIDIVKVIITNFLKSACYSWQQKMTKRFFKGDGTT